MTFRELEIAEPILKAICEKGYEKPTPIQEKGIPVALGGGDMLGIAQTGTGKTATFAIPILQHLLADRSEEKSSETRGNKGRLVKRRAIKALILTPTRELAIQIGENITDYGKYTGIRHAIIFGGVKQGPQTDLLQAGVDILVATPGRLLDLIRQGYVNLSSITHFVLDEADRMLDMGFIHDIKRILPLLPRKRQSLFFSATMPPEIERLAGTILHEPEKVEVTPVSSTVDTIDQSVYFVEKVEKINLLKNLLEDRSLESVLVFTRTKHGADKVARVLNKSGIGAEAIHGNKGQSARQRALSSFKDHTLRVLIATDIASRGIDVDHLSHVINYDLPNVPETYVHRIGRAGRSGIAFSFCDVEEVPYLKDIQKLIGKEVPVAGGHMFETVEVKEAVAEKKKAIKEESKRRNMFGSKRDGSFWRNKKRTAAK